MILDGFARLETNEHDRWYVAIEISRRTNSCPNRVTCQPESGVETSVSWENGNASENVCRRDKNSSMEISSRANRY